MSLTQTPRSLVRSLGGRMLRGLRPFGAPFLNRLQLRMGQAVLDTGVVGRLDRTEAAVGRTEAMLDQVQVQLRALQIGLDAVRSDQENFSRPVLAALNDMTARSDGIAGLTSIVLGRADALLARGAVSLGTEVLMRSPEGYLLVPAEDPALVTAMYESGGQLEPGTVAVIRGILRERDTALDVGANIGLTVLPAARCVGASGRVIAVEAGGRVADLLRRSLALNGLDGRVTLHRAAAGEREGVASLNLGAVSGHSSLLALPGAERSEEVPVRRLDDIVPPGTRIRLAKIDVEGYEPQVWQGMRRILDENPEMAVLIEFGPGHLRRAGVAPDEWFGVFGAAGFTAHEVDEAGGPLRPVRPLAELVTVPSVNLLMLRQPPSAFPGLRFA